MKTKYTYKPGTIGLKIEKLVAQFGHYPMGHHILESALEQVSGVEHAIITVNGLTVGQTPGYKAAILEENKRFGRCGIVWYKPELAIAKKYTPEGRCVAIRFAPGMTEESMRASVERDPASANEWFPYDESTNTFPVS